MKTTRLRFATALLIIGLGAPLLGADKDVRVVNTPAEPVPTVAQGTTQVAGAVAVSNLPATQAVTGTVAVAPPARPVLLMANPGLNLDPILDLTPYVFFWSGHLDEEMSGRLALSSITIAVTSLTVPRLTVNLGATDCGANGLGPIVTVVVAEQGTVHLPFPTPLVIPDSGPRPRICVQARFTGASTVNRVYMAAVGELH